MIRHWKTYEGGPNGGKVSTRPRITLSRGKVFLLNEAAYNSLGGPAAVELRFDEDNMTIGIKPKDPRHANAFPLKTKDTGSKYKYRLIHASPFCKHFDIRPTNTMLFPEPDMDNDGTLLLERKKAVKVGRGSR